MSKPAILPHPPRCERACPRRSGRRRGKQFRRLASRRPPRRRPHGLPADVGAPRIHLDDAAPGREAPKLMVRKFSPAPKTRTQSAWSTIRRPIAWENEPRMPRLYGWPRNMSLPRAEVISKAPGLFRQRLQRHLRAGTVGTAPGDDHGTPARAQHLHGGVNGLSARAALAGRRSGRRGARRPGPPPPSSARWWAAAGSRSSPVGGPHSIGQGGRAVAGRWRKKVSPAAPSTAGGVETLVVRARRVHGSRSAAAARHR